MFLVHTKVHTYTWFQVLLVDGKLLEKFNTLWNFVIQQGMYFVGEPRLVKETHIDE